MSGIYIALWLINHESWYVYMTYMLHMTNILQYDKSMRTNGNLKLKKKYKLENDTFCYIALL